MAKNTETLQENEVIDTIASSKDAELDFVNSLLKAADYKNDEAYQEIFPIERHGEKLFEIRVRPISEDETVLARKKSRVMAPTPGNKKILYEKDLKTNVFHSWLIYLATVDEDKEKIWNNKAIKQKYGLMEPYESVDILLTAIEKTNLVNKIMDISGFEDEDDTEDIVKN